MKQFLFVMATACILTGCSVLNVPTADVKGNVYKYNYVYVIPTSGVTSSSGVYGNQYGVYGGSTKTVNPSEVISGYLMKKGYTTLPNIDPNLAENTMIVSYGYTGRRQLSLFSYAPYRELRAPRYGHGHFLPRKGRGSGLSCRAPKAGFLL